MPHITDDFIHQTISHPETGQTIIRDNLLKGFGLRITKNGAAFILERRVDGQLRRVTLGKTDSMTLDEARSLATKHILGASTLVDKNTKCVTLLEVFQLFLKTRKLSPNTARSYTAMLRRCLGDWLDLPISEITRDMVQKRHQELTRRTRQGTTGEIQANMAMRLLSTLLNFSTNHFVTSSRNL